jgi:hypothetical protein
MVLESSDTHWTPLLHWTETELAGMAQRFSRHYEAWGRDWMTRADFWELAPVRVGAVPMMSSSLNGAHAVLPLHSEHTAAEAGAPHAWIAFPTSAAAARSESLAQLVVRLLFGEPAMGDSDSFAAGVGLAALAGLAAIVQAATGIAEAAVAPAGSALHEELPPQAFHAWAGCVKLSLPGSGGAAIYLNGVAARNLLGAGQGESAPNPIGGLTPIQQAAGATTIGLGVRLNPVELTFGQLKSLQVGDVVILPHAVEEPLRVVTQFDTLLCKAYLGRSGDRRALQVVRDTAPAGTSPD